jgi:hypothetical protein
VIVRISTEGQYEVHDEIAERLNDLDNEAVTAVEAGDEERFHTIFESMLELVRTDGRAVNDDDELHESDVILPPPDLSFVEAGEQFTGEGLIPD